MAIPPASSSASTAPHIDKTSLVVGTLLGSMIALVVIGVALAYAIRRSTRQKAIQNEPEPDQDIEPGDEKARSFRDSIMSSDKYVIAYNLFPEPLANSTF